MSGVLLDTHALYWLASGAKPLSDAALIVIEQAQRTGTLFVSPITAWELAIAASKPAHKDPPQFQMSPAKWFRTAVRATSAKVIPIGQSIAVEAAEASVATGHKDSGDCYLIATSRARSIPLVTRDRIILRLAERGHLAVVVC